MLFQKRCFFQIDLVTSSASVLWTNKNREVNTDKEHFTQNTNYWVSLKSEPYLNTLLEKTTLCYLLKANIISKTVIFLVDWFCLSFCSFLSLFQQFHFSQPTSAIRLPRLRSYGDIIYTKYYLDFTQMEGGCAISRFLTQTFTNLTSESYLLTWWA